MSFPSLFEILSIGITFVISISLHEYAHAYASNYFGDPTPRLQGRLTPNPLVHIDPLGFVLIFLINFGRGRPVQIDPSYYRHRLRDELIVALAGPAVNILLGSIAALIVLVIIKLQGPLGLYTGENILIQFRYLFGRINMGLAVFNMIPLPPLDGYRVIKYLFPKAGYRLEANGRILGIILLAAILLPTPAQYYLQSLIVGGAQMLYGLAQMFWGVVLWWI